MNITKSRQNLQETIRHLEAAMDYLNIVTAYSLCKDDNHNDQLDRLAGVLQTLADEIRVLLGKVEQAYDDISNFELFEEVHS